MILTPEGPQSVQTLGFFFRFSRFSPFAEEGFTCLDHSMLSKKKERLKGHSTSCLCLFDGVFPRKKLHIVEPRDLCCGWLVGWSALFCPVLFYLLLLCSSQLDKRPGGKHV